MNFTGFIGNKKLKTVFETAHNNNRLPHAFILGGEDGLGKRSFAKLIARAAVCMSENNKPCGTCPACIRSLAGSHPDINTEEGSGVSGAISVSAIKSIIENAYRAPREANYKVNLLFVKDKLSEPVQNKLLKVLEEPPGNTIFIIVIKSPDSLLPTIKSRAPTFMLSPVNEQEGIKFLCENYEVDEEKARELTDKFSGNLGLCISNILESSGMEAINLASSFAKSLISENEDALLSLSAVTIKDRQLFSEMLKKLILIFRDACVSKEGAKTFIGSDKLLSKELASKLRMSTLVNLQEICTVHIDYNLKNLNMNLLVTSFCATMKKVVLN